MPGPHGALTREIVARAQRALGRADPGAPSRSKEPCSACGEETAVGSVFFSDRLALTGPDGGRTFLCSDCDASARAAKKPWRPDEHEVDRLAENGSMAAGVLLGGGGGI